MKKFSYVLLGFTTGLVCVQLINKAFEVILLWMDTLNIKPVEKILKHKANTSSLREFTKPEPEHTDYEVEYIYDDDDYEE